MGPALFTLGKRPSLDGLRALSVLLVLAGHSNWKLVLDDGGLVGVAVFFTISGFLITTLIMEEWAQRGRLDLPAFYARRAIRLFPALLAVVAVCVARGFSPVEGAMVLLYLSNFMVASENFIVPLTHTWSLAVEEQFYLLAPLTMVLARGRWRRWAMGAAAVIVAIWAWRFAYWTSVEESIRWIYNGPTRIDGILVGCILAVWFRFRGEWRPKWWVTLPAWAFLLWYGSSFWKYSWSYFTVGMIGLQIACVIVVAWAVTFTGRWLTWQPLLYVAKISYGLYLWHYLVFLTPQIDVLPQPIRSWVEWTLSFALAVVSWYWLERPIARKFRGRFVRKGDPALVQTPAPASVPGR